MIGKVILEKEFNRRVETPEGSTIITNKYKQERIEINEYYIKQGKTVYFNPPKVKGAVKTYYLISGRIETKGDVILCGKGTIVILLYQDDVFYVRALEGTRVLIHSIDDDSFQETEARFRYVYNLLQEIQNKDAYTLYHSNNVHCYADKIVTKLGWSGSKHRNLLMAARYHDLGKIYIPDNILNKPSSFSDDEFDVMKTHVTEGKDLLVQFFSEEMYAIAVQHHERLDGSGYPHALKGDEISLEGRILAICDSYDAMTSDRVYKSKMSKQEAIEELRTLKNTKYDAEMVEVFIDILLNDDETCDGEE